MVETATQSAHCDGIELSWGVATDVGKVRRLNEDAHLEAPGGFVVADGMGGHQAGDVASRLTIEAVKSLLDEGIPDIVLLGDVVKRANDSVRAHATESGREGMGTTMVGAFLVRNADDTSLVIVNVGDSRCYVAVDGEVRQVTKDHSHVQELVDLGQITREQAAAHPERNVVTRAIGIEDSVAADFFVLPPAPVTRLLLCSDGVSGELAFEQLAAILVGTEDPGDCAKALIDSVLAGRAADNATALVVDVRRDPASIDVDEDTVDITGPRIGRIVETEITAPTPQRTAPSEALISDVPEVAESRRATSSNRALIDDVPT